jgi:hypothetical protein
MRLNHSTTRSPRQQPHFPSGTHEWPQLTDVRPGLPIPPPAAVSPAGIITARTGASIDLGAPVFAFREQAHNIDAETKAFEIRLRAERRCGQLLSEREMAKGTRGQFAGGSTLRPPETAQLLAGLGISKT